MKRTINLPGHFEGELHINLGANPLKMTISKTPPDGVTPISSDDDDGPVCFQKCVKRDDDGACIDWVTVCHP